MDEQNSFFTEYKSVFKNYLHNRFTLIKLQAVDTVSRLVGALVVGVLLAVIGFVALLFISFMLGYYFSSLTGSNFAGFSIIAAFYVILFLIIIIFRKSLVEKLIMNAVIKVLFDKNKDHHDHDFKADNH